MTDFRAALKSRSGPKPGSEIKASTPAKVDFRSLLNKKDGSPKAPAAATPPPSSAPSDFRSLLNKKQAPEPEKTNEQKTEQNSSKVAPKTPQKEKQSGVNGVNGGAIDKKVNVKENATPEKKPSGPGAGTTEKKEKATPEKKTSDGKISETNDKKAKVVNGGEKDAGKLPVFKQSLSDITVVDGERLRLECQVTSDPKAVITWILDGKVVKASKFIVLSQE
ncbi:hypothetical protein M9458_013376, partial [Cirrhinus mrigala]